METVLASLENNWVWVAVNIVLPVLLPVGGLWMIRLSMPKPGDTDRGEEVLETRRYVLLFKDGQLGWVALPMCFAAISEFCDGLLMHHHPAPSWTLVFFLIVAVTIYAVGILATNGALESVSVKQTGSLIEWIDYYSVAFWTTIFAVIAATALGIGHFWATPQ